MNDFSGFAGNSSTDKNLQNIVLELYINIVQDTATNLMAFCQIKTQYSSNRKRKMMINIEQHPPLPPTHVSLNKTSPLIQGRTERKKENQDRNTLSFISE